MGALKTLTRRTFLIGSTAIAGGVAFGVYTAKKPHDNPLAADAGAGDASFNPWVKVNQNGITLIAPHADTGQGVQHMQLTLIAEELDVGYDQFTADFGVPSAAYYNTAMGAELAPFRSHDKSATAELARSAFGTLGKVVGLQGTGGSSSVPDSFTKLREAGAVARETLKLAASTETGVPVDQLKTERAEVALPDGRRLAYTALAATAATLEPVKTVTLRSPDAWRLIGKETLRCDMVEKCTGTLAYGIDLNIEGMVHASIKLNPRQGGSVGAIDDTAARAMRGVSDVIPVTGGVAVIADNTWRAIQGAKAVKAEWGDAPYPVDMADHWKEVANSFVPERLDSTWRDEGTVDDALDGADVISAEYKTPYVAHQPLEPLNAIVTVSEDRVDVWSSHQVPRFVQQKVAGVTGHDATDVHFHNQWGGGSFGHRLEFDNITLAAEIANTRRGTPVKLTYSREEDFAHDYPRQIAMGRGRGSVQNGEIKALDLSVASVSAVTSQMGRLGIPAAGPDKQLAEGAWSMPWTVPHMRVATYRVPELAPTSSWRSVGASSGGFFSESFIDELIHAAGKDPLEERLRLASTDQARRVLKAMAELSNWGTALGPNSGRGIACVESFGVTVAEVVEVTQTDNGIKLDKVYVVADVGTVVDPINFDNHVKGGVVWGLGHAMNCEITYRDGMAEQSNYHAHAGMRLHQCPEIVVKALEDGPVRGIGEPPVPPAAPALANAIFAATGQRLREMPFHHHIDFV